jgi:hypothetical protein
VQTTLEQKETKATKNQSSGQTGPGILGIVKSTAGGPRLTGRLFI